MIEKRIPFKATIRDAGGYFVVTIPKQYVDNGLLKEGNTYQFTVTEEMQNDNEC